MGQESLRPKHELHLTNLNQLDINDLTEMREVYSKNPILGLRDAFTKVHIGTLCIDKSKLDNSFPDSQRLIENYQFPPLRRDRNSKRGGKIDYVRQGLKAKEF